MRYVTLILSILTVVGCVVPVQTTRPPITHTYELRERRQIIDELSALLVAEQIGIATKDIGKGIIVTDSFDVLPEYCDCGKNLLGAEYPGQRRGVMRVNVSDGRMITVTIYFKTRLRITANNRLLLCTSRGVLENKLLTALEKELGGTAIH
ncbi:MAG: hypothetical protein E4G91_07735 [Candidatus Zixiibacteriota bacterium]|nr:MAG: hypothetical protein E4G91_07735 [candidate division Zixibacteria bacterium]